jgi:hypothetical protein
VGRAEGDGDGNDAGVGKIKYMVGVVGMIDVAATDPRLFVGCAVVGAA